MKCCGETERGNKEKCALGLFDLTETVERGLCVEHCSKCFTHII